MPIVSNTTARRHLRHWSMGLTVVGTALGISLLLLGSFGVGGAVGSSLGNIGVGILYAAAVTSWIGAFLK